MPNVIRPYPLSAYGVQAHPDRRAIVLNLEYLGLDPSGRETPAQLAPVVMAASAARAIADQLLMAAAEVERASPLAPSAADH